MRALDWDGYRNCRDLGGLPTSSGLTRPGRVARGPRRELLTTAGWAQARSWGLRTVVDLRCADEVAGATPEAIADDYAASVRAMAGGAPSNAPTPDRQAGWGTEEVARWLTATRPLVVDFAAGVRRHLDQVGLRPTAREHLRALLLAP